VLFEELRDDRNALVPGSAAMVHVQVHNRGLLPAAKVHVWAIWANTKDGAPLLDATDGAPFNFWSQFNATTGAIDTKLPSGSPWTGFGPPFELQPIDAANPQVATWSWNIPQSFDPKHYVVAIFVHCHDSPLVENSTDLDDVAPRQPQVGALFVGDPCAALRTQVQAADVDDSSLQEQLKTANDSEKPKIIAEIEKNHNLKVKLNAAYTRCRKHHPH
jgi:hypothetical protein